jgi:predicted glycosyltransferase
VSAAFVYVFGGARGIGRIQRATKLAILLREASDGQSIHLVACEDAGFWPMSTDLSVSHYQFGEQPLATEFTADGLQAVFVDGYPDGPSGALAELLPLIRARSPRTRIILVMRDILDAPDRVIARLRGGGYGLLEKYYDGIVVLGSKEVFDVGLNYALPTIPIYYLGYLPPILKGEISQFRSAYSTNKRILASSGGGDDADWMPNVVRTLSAAGLAVLAIGGAKMPEPVFDRLMRQADNSGARVLRRVHSITPYMAMADCAVIGGGYNTLSEALYFNVSTVVIPREEPTLEQHIRALQLQRIVPLHIVRRKCVEGGKSTLLLSAVQERLIADTQSNAQAIFATPHTAAGLLQWLSEL